MPSMALDGLERTLAALGPMTPGLGSLVRSNMMAAGVYEVAHLKAYFRNVARHLANGARLFRLRQPADLLSRLAEDEVDVDASVELVRQASAGGRGVLIAPAHSCNYLVSLARLRRDVSLCIYLRWSKNARRLEMKRRWCHAAGIDVIVEPASAADPTARAAACVDALRDGKNVAITPDIAQKATEGVPVTWFGRRACLPAGPASLAMLAETAMLPLFSRWSGERQTLYFEKPIPVPLLPRGEGGRPEAVRRAMQTWCDGCENYLRACPPAWFLWADSRWTRVLRGDPRYGSAPKTGECRETGTRVDGGGVATPESV
jgi:KDO2-lipid IV(A) lauroyltransferase